MLLGGLLPFEQHIRDKYNFDTNPLVNLDLTPFDPSTTSYELEKNRTYELGYRGIIAEKIFIDTYYYTSTFENFGGSSTVIQANVTPTDPTGFENPTVYFIDRSVTDQEIKSEGFVFGLSYSFASNFELSGNYAWNTLSNEQELQEDGFLAGFNTPENKVNFSLGNRKLTDRLGFNVSWRWQEEFRWESPFAIGDVPAFSTLDLQVSYAIPGMKSRLKVGGSNILNERYIQAVGNPTIGALYYASITFDEFFRK